MRDYTHREKRNYISPDFSAAWFERKFHLSPAFGSITCKFKRPLSCLCDQIQDCTDDNQKKARPNKVRMIARDHSHWYTVFWASVSLTLQKFQVVRIAIRSHFEDRIISPTYGGCSIVLNSKLDIGQ